MAVNVSEAETGRRKVRTTIVDRGASAAADCVKRDFNPAAPDRRPHATVPRHDDRLAQLKESRSVETRPTRAGIGIASPTAHDHQRDSTRSSPALLRYFCGSLASS